AVIPAVILIFRFNEVRQVAALQAGLLFVFVPLIFLLRETLKFKSRHWWFLGGHLQFLLFFALPIMILRLTHWGQPFGEITFMGLSGQKLHGLSNYSYTLMIATTLWTFRKLQWQARQQAE
ncbi:MAG: hypothetical protein ACLGGX_11475, partial [Bdellovibrionia bacterium]